MNKSSFDKIFNSDPNNVPDFEEEDIQRTGEEIAKAVEENLPPALIRHCETELVEINPEQIEKDYTFARNSLIELAEVSQRALVLALDNASRDSKAQSIEAVSSMIQTSSDVVTQLTELTLKYKETQERLKNINHPQTSINGQVINNQFNIGTMSTSELLKLLNENDKNEEEIVDGDIV